MKQTSVKHSPAKSKARPETWLLRLYVAGETSKSKSALANLQTICGQRLKGEFQIEVVDLVKQPQLAMADQIIALPTLVRKLPPPLKKIVGDLSNTETVLVHLDLKLDE